MGLVGYVQMGIVRNAYRILVRKPEGKRPFARLRYSSEYYIKRDLTEIGHESMGWS
jgi:hypothetical protein